MLCNSSWDGRIFWNAMKIVICIHNFIPGNYRMSKCPSPLKRKNFEQIFIFQSSMLRRYVSFYVCSVEKNTLPKYIESDNKNPRRSLHQGPKKNYSLRIQACPKFLGLTLQTYCILLWGWDWDHQTYENSGRVWILRD